MPDEQEAVHMPHDTGYKYLLASKKAFIQLIKSFVKAGWTSQVDEANLVRVDKSFILQDFKYKEADLVYRARLKDKDVIFYVLMELQSSLDYLIPYRLLLYMTEIWRDVFNNSSQNEVQRKDFRLPVIVPIVLYNNPAKWTVPLDFKETLDSSELFAKHVLDFRYILINVFAYDEKELLELSNLIGAVFLLDRGRNLEEILNRLEKLIITIKKMDKEEFRLFTAWTENILTRDVSPEKKVEIVRYPEKHSPRGGERNDLQRGTGPEKVLGRG